MWNALIQFSREDGIDKCSILAYYSLFSSLFLLAFFTYIFSRFLGDPQSALKLAYPFSPDFFTDISPSIMRRAQNTSEQLRKIGITGIVLSAFMGFLLISKIVRYVNEMFHIDFQSFKTQKGLIVRRIKEVGFLSFIGFLIAGSFFFTSIVTMAADALSPKSKFHITRVNFDFIHFIDAFLIKYVLSFFITFLFFLILYKWIPEKPVYFKGAVIAAVISTIVWETIKYLYTYYVVHVSIFGRVKGPLIGLILFGFWMEFSMGIMLYGAKLTYIFDREKNDKLKKNQ